MSEATVRPDRRPPKLLDRVRARVRTLHYSYRTEKAYLYWIRQFILFSGRRHPKSLGKAEIEHYLSHLAVDRRVSASTQNQALCAILFLYKRVLEVDIGWLDNIVRAKTPERVPVVLSRDEVEAVLNRMSGKYWLMASLMYGARLRVTECPRLRIKDLDFDFRQKSGTRR